MDAYLCVWEFVHYFTVKPVTNEGPCFLPYARTHACTCAQAFTHTRRSHAHGCWCMFKFERTYPTKRNHKERMEHESEGIVNWHRLRRLIVTIYPVLPKGTIGHFLGVNVWRGPTQPNTPDPQGNFTSDAALPWVSWPAASTTTVSKVRICLIRIYLTLTHTRGP